MKKRSDEPAESLRAKIMGFGETSFRKSYYPELQKKFQELERFKELLDQANDIIMLLQVPSGRIADISHSASHRLEFPRHELLGMKISRLLPADAWARLEVFFQGDGSPPASKEVMMTCFRRSGGDEFPVEITFRLVPFNEEVFAVAVARNIADRLRSEQLIVQQNQFLNLVLESLTHPFYVLDARDYTVKVANSAAGFGGITPGMTCYSLTHKRTEPCHGTEHDCPLRIVKETRQSVVLEHIHYDSDGMERNVEIHAYPIFDASGEVVQIIEYVHDVTGRKRMEEELRQSAQKIKLFAYSISHDLKSPIIGINGLVNLLCRQYQDRLDDRGRRYCDQILKTSGQVVSLIEEINLYIRAKETPLMIESVDLGEVLQEVKSEFDALLCTCKVEWIAPDNLPVVFADRISLIRMIRNLVDNSLKYGGKNLSQLRFDYKDSEEFHIISVTDDGAGIKKEECSNIFDLFQRKEAARGIEGLGLGLAIVKEIACKHGGTVSVHPGEDRGVTFSISISKRLG